MALLTPPFALGAAGQVLSGKVLRHAVGAAWRPSSAVLGAVSGVVQGPAGSMMELTLLTPTSARVNPGTAVIQGTFATDQGQYVVTNDAAVTVTWSGQSASQYRRALIIAEAADSQVAGVASSPTTDRAILRVVEGNLSPTGPGALPALPATALALGEVSIPPTGQTVTLTPYNPRTVARGGVQPVFDDTSTVPGHGGEPGAYVDQLRMRAGRMERWNGSAWEWPKAAQGILSVKPYEAQIILSNAATGLPAFDTGTVTLPSRRLIRQTFVANVSVDAIPSIYGFLLQRDGVAINRLNINPALAGAGYSVTGMTSHIQNLPAGTYSWSIMGGRMAGNGTFTLTAAPDFNGPAQHVIEDLGAA